MKRVDEGKRSNKWILPLAAGIMVVIAVIVVLFIPKGTDKGGDNTINQEADQGSVTAQPADAVAETDGEGKLNGCNSEIVVPAYDLFVKLHEGENIVSFIPDETGTIPYSCWMGMIKSSINVVE